MYSIDLRGGIQICVKAGVRGVSSLLKGDVAAHDRIDPIDTIDYSYCRWEHC